MGSRVTVVNLLPTALVLVGLALLWRFLSVVQVGVMLLMLSLVLSAALYPLVRFVNERLRLPRPIAVFGTVFGALAVLAAFVWFLVPTLMEQLGATWTALTHQGQFAADLRRYGDANPWIGRMLQSDSAAEFGRSLRTVPGPLMRGLMQVSSNLLALAGYAFVVLLLMLYTLGRPEPLLRGLIGAVPEKWRPRVVRATEDIVSALRVWGLSTLAVMASGGVLVFMGLTVLGVPNALVYAFLSALGELIPNLGPTVANGVPVLVTFAQDPGRAVAVAAWLIAVQVVQGIVSPYLFGRTVSLHPVSIITGILLLGTAFGLVGAFLTVPFLIIAKVLYEAFWLSRADLPEVPEEQVAEILEQA
ncbi:AI-2E family transporter [Deinococcus pimensis]|uniref:AI-2E family transporter n=1 Tax=Deinococcus pimensis TaxID=309888 RepID=UPI000484A5E2|nr:AI-2E family transporter [Deinococcus pimensis]